MYNSNKKAIKLSRNVSSENPTISAIPINNKLKANKWNSDLQDLINEDNTNSSILVPVTDETKVDVETSLQPTFNFASYASRSKTLKHLIDLDVNLYKIERRKGLMQFLLPLDFDKDMKGHILFLTQQIGLNPDCLGTIITKNPLIFKENLDNLQIRINYLESKRFTSNDICTIIEKNPFWLMFTTKRIDARLGFFQKEFQLTGNQIRKLALISPKLITYNLNAIRENTFSIKEEMCLEKDEIGKLLLINPKLWIICELDSLFTISFSFYYN